MATNPLIGRKKELAEIRSLYESGKPELLAVYGRRRVGKTFLIDEALKGKITFRHAGLSPVEKTGNMKMQLKHFFISLKLHGYEGEKEPKSWLDAFYMLEQLLTAKDEDARQVVFLDELPWMDTPRSGFVTAFEGFWNGWACHRSNVMVVVCGSANSWILDNLIDSHGGLYGRTTYEIKLSPFSLAECREFYRAKGVLMSEYDMVQSYMILGGIPYYLGYLKKDLSLTQNVGELFWGRGARLRQEYDRLFCSAFDSPEAVKTIVKFLSKRHKGFTRKEIEESLGGGGQLTKRLKALVASDFVTEYVPFGHGRRDVHYKLSDPFCLFHLHFVQGSQEEDADYWLSLSNTQRVISWRGLAFEEVCFNHVRQIKEALGVSGVSSQVSSWIQQGTDERPGTQIDLLLMRKDNVVNMCEMKFYNEEFAVDKDYDALMRRRISMLSEHLPKRAVVHPTIITTFGLKRNSYSGIFVRELTLEDLFRG